MVGRTVRVIIRFIMHNMYRYVAAKREYMWFEVFHTEKNNHRYVPMSITTYEIAILHV